MPRWKLHEGDRPNEGADGLPAEVGKLVNGRQRFLPNRLCSNMPSILILDTASEAHSDRRERQPNAVVKKGAAHSPVVGHSLFGLGNISLITMAQKMSAKPASSIQVSSSP